MWSAYFKRYRWVMAVFSICMILMLVLEGNGWGPLLLLLSGLSAFICSFMRFRTLVAFLQQ